LWSNSGVCAAGSSQIDAQEFNDWNNSRSTYTIMTATSTVRGPQLYVASLYKSISMFEKANQHILHG
jgi:hypothetical protein